MKGRLLLLYMGLIVYSCTNEETAPLADSQESPINRSLPIENNSAPIIGSIQDLYELFGIKMEENQEPVLPSNISYSNLDEFTATGYTRIVESRSMKGIFSGDFAESMGLQANVIYLYKWLFVEKEINTGGRTFFQIKTDNCGMVPVIDDQYIEVTDFRLRGYKVIKGGNTTVLKTHIFFVETDLSGVSYNRYIPIKPDELQWSYYLY